MKKDDKNAKQNKTVYKFKMKSLNELDPNNSQNIKLNQLVIKPNLNTNNKNLLSNTVENLDKEPIAKLSNFTGFYFKKFNLTNYKKERDDSRSRSQSPERIYTPHQLRGNGIPNDILERTLFLSKIFNSEKFQNFYKNKPKKRRSSFNNMVDYILSYRKNNSELEAVMMVFYFICHEIKFDVNAKGKKSDNKNAQKPYKIYESGRALSLGFTNIFEYMLKKLEIKYKHIKGYCKKLPKNNKVSYNSPAHDENKKNNIIINKNNSNFNTTNFNTTNYNTTNFNTTYYNTSNFNTTNYKTTYNTTSNSLNNTANHITKKTLSNSPHQKKKTKKLNDGEIINHCWNAVFIKNEWYFIDTCLGSGGMEEYKIPFIYDEDNNRRSFDYAFNPFYFMTPPHLLIISHRPSDDLWQFTEKTYNFKQFMKKQFIDISPFYRGIYQHDNIELITHNNPLIKITSKDNLIIKVRLTNYIFAGDLYPLNGKHKISEIKYTLDEKTNIFIFEPSFPSNGEYIIRINARPLVSNDLVYKPLLDYIVKIKDKENYVYFEKYRPKTLTNFKNEKSNENILLPKLSNNNNNNQLTLSTRQPKIVTDYLNIFPSKYNKKICYDDEGFHLIEPRYAYLKKGTSVKFKIRISGTSSVAILDGNKWFYLKKCEKNVYEGEKEIQTDNVCICCLRGKNVYTELYRFKPLKEKSVDSKMFMFKIKKKKV